MLQELLPFGAFAFLLVFVRTGAMLMSMPGIGEAYVSPRIRLGLALAVALAMTPLVMDTLPREPVSPWGLLMLLVREMVVGLMIGLAARMTMSALHVAGTVIAFQSSLGFAQFFDPAQGTQGALVSAFLGLLGLVLIFATDLHLLMLRAAHDSYELMPPTAAIPLEDLVGMGTQFVANSFKLGAQLAAPFIVYAMVYYIGLGLLQRLMPQLQLFFVGMPLQIMMALFVLMMTVSAIMIWFLDHFEGAMSTFLAS